MAEWMGGWISMWVGKVKVEYKHNFLQIILQHCNIVHPTRCSIFIHAYAESM